MTGFETWWNVDGRLAVIRHMKKTLELFESGLDEDEVAEMIQKNFQDLTYKAWLAAQKEALESEEITVSWVKEKTKEERLRVKIEMMLGMKTIYNNCPSNSDLLEGVAQTLNDVQKLLDGVCGGRK